MTKLTGLIQALLLSAVLAVGFGAVWAMLAAWIVEAGHHVTRDNASFEMLRIERDGTPLIQRYSASNQPTFRDLDGKLVTPAEGAFVQFAYQSVPLAPHLPEAKDDFDWARRIRSFSDFRDPATYWYMVSDGRVAGSAYFVGYDSQSNRLIGYIGTAGFREQSLPDEERFPFSGPVTGLSPRLIAPSTGIAAWTQYPGEHASIPQPPPGYVAAYDLYILGRDSNFYHINLRDRLVEASLHGKQISSAGFSLTPDDALRGTSVHPIARTDDAVLLLDEHGRERKRLSIPEPLRGRTLVFCETTSGDVVMYATSPDDSLVEAVECQIFRVSPDGHAREFNVRLAVFNNMRTLRFTFAAVLPSPAALFGIMVTSRSWQLMDLGLATTKSEATARALREFWPDLAIAQIVALGLAILCFRRQVRYGASGTERIVWPLFVLLFGLPGWIGYRFGRSWPDLETCQACGAAVPADRVACVRCSHEFSRPALIGTEVFA